MVSACLRLPLIGFARNGADGTCGLRRSAGFLPWAKISRRRAPSSVLQCLANASRDGLAPGMAIVGVAIGFALATETERRR